MYGPTALQPLVIEVLQSPARPEKGNRDAEDHLPREVRGVVIYTACLLASTGLEVHVLTQACRECHRARGKEHYLWEKYLLQDTEKVTCISKNIEIKF